MHHEHTRASSTSVSNMGNFMRFVSKTTLVGLMAALALTGCTRGQDDVVRVQTNLVDKSIFEGEWWVLTTVVDADGDSTDNGGMASVYVYPGGSTFDLSGQTQVSGDVFGGGLNVGRIRFVVDEDFLYAYRSYELIDGGNDDGRESDFRGQPLAAFAIEDHVDVRRSYSSLTGEVTNVIEENSSDRRWYERQYARIDWSTNHAQSMAFLTDWVDNNNWMRESASFYIPEDSSHPDFQPHLAPQFVRVGEDPDYRFADEWPEEMSDTVHYMSFTSMMLISPQLQCNLFVGGPPSRCQTLSVPVRTAFLRVPPNHEYAAETQQHTEFDRFGLFRTYQRTYVRGGANQLEANQFCRVDQDCGTGGYCDLERNVCAGGLTDDYGETDFLTFYRPRHNFFRNVHTDTPCRADWECSGAFEERPGTPGSVCDPAARRCTVPLAERELRQVRYHLNDGYPVHLVKSAYEVMGNWNEVFMRGWRTARNQPVPDYTVGTIPVQTDDPTAYCFEGSAEDEGGTCRTEYNPFTSPDEWAALGVENAYDCYVQNADGYDDPARPTSYDEFTLPSAYRWEFVGEECAFLLETNTCDWHRSDADVHCNDVTDENDEPVVWEQQGDIRYQFFAYIDQPGTRFGGISELRTDAVSGELITADANIASASVESRTWLANELFPLLRCRSERGCAPGDEGADEAWLSGENARGYFANRGRIARPVRVAPSGTDGITVEDYSRPAMPVGHMRRQIMDRVDNAMPRIERLYGEEAGFQIFQNRINQLEGSPRERAWLEGLNGEIMDPLFTNQLDGTTTLSNDTRASDADMADQVSPFRADGMLQTFQNQQMERIRMQNMGVDFFENAGVESFLRNRYYEYWAEAFRGRSGAEASIRMQQLYTRAVQHHEIGHSVGLRHNFGGSYDRNNYGDGYFQLTVRDGLALPEVEDYDLVENGGNDDAFVGANELNAYNEELRRVRNERAARGAHNYMTASIMDYNGDTSDSYGLGRYDVAATIWNYFGKVEAYVGDPRIESTDSTNDLHMSDVTGRVWWTSYEGGESCEADVDCPNGPGSPALSEGQPVYQRCIRNTRNTRLPEPCGGEEQCQCSAFLEDMKDYVDGFAYNNDVDGDRELDHFPVRYMFCPDERSTDISWCSTGDAGESFQETIDHYRRRFEEGYHGYFRRFNRGVARGAAVSSIANAAKIYQHVFFRYFFEPGFLSNEGPLGVLDQFNASADAMNWFIEITNFPEIGSYELDEEHNVYRYMGEDLEMAGADAALPAGLGYGMWTKYQDGHQGFFRAERGGVYFDKQWAMYALALRDWGLSFTVDERYFINFYDLYPLEMTEFFGGMILDEPSWHAPRLVEGPEGPEIINPQYNQGLIFGECQVRSRLQPCVAPTPETYPEPAIDGTSNIWLRDWATILALSTFPVFYDTSFEQRFIIWRLGTGAGANIPDTRPDGTPACVYGSYAVDESHEMVDPAGPERCNSIEDATYAVYYSERLHQSYAAVKVTPRFDYNTEEEQLGFQYLRKLIDLQTEFEAATGAERDELERELVENESYMNMLLTYMQIFGISNTFGI